MPRYQFACGPCAYEWEGWASLEQYQQVQCPFCFQPVQVVFWTPATCPQTQRPGVDAQFGHGQGYYDEGLGTWVRTRAHREAIMRAKGLHETTKYDRDRALADPSPPPELSDAQAKDLFERAEMDVKYQKRPPTPAPAPDVQAKFDQIRSRVYDDR